MRSLPAAVRTAVVAAAALALAACSSPTPGVLPGTPAPNASVTATLGSLAYYQQVAALDGSVAASQLEILDAAVKADQLSFEAYSEAINESLACIADAGVEVDGPRTDNSSGYPQISYGFAAGMGADGKPDNPVPDDCIRRYSQYVEIAYTSQPASQEALDQALAKKRPDVERCVDRAGIQIDSSLELRDWFMAVADSGDAGRDCLMAAEVFEF